MGNCILCGAKATINVQDNASRTIYNCQSCGVFVVSDLIESEVAKHGGELAGYFTNRKLAGYNEIVLISFDKAKKDKDYLQLTVEQILGYCPKTFSERVDMALTNLSMMSAYEGAEIRVENLDMAPVFHLKTLNYDALSFIIKSMQKLELLEVNYYGGTFFPCGVIISPKGWSRLSEMSSGQITWNHVLVLHNGEEDDAFHTAAGKAARECGYVMESTLTGMGSRINLELVAMIKGSRCVITDVTDASGVAYYAAGMTAALGKPNILLCNAKKRKQLQMDTRQFSVLSWDDDKDLYLQILNAIRALV